MLILAVNVLAVNRPLPLYIVSQSVIYTLYRIASQRYIVSKSVLLTRSPCFSRSAAEAAAPC